MTFTNNVVGSRTDILTVLLVTLEYCNLSSQFPSSVIDRVCGNGISEILTLSIKILIPLLHTGFIYVFYHVIHPECPLGVL